MREMTNILGCFPDVQCLWMLIRPTVIDGLAVLAFVMGILVGAMVALCIVASIEGGR